MNALNAFFTWWLRQMRELAASLPGRTSLPDAVIVAIDPPAEGKGARPSGHIIIRRKGAEQVTAGLDFAARKPGAPPNLPVGLRLPPGMVLQRDVTLPLVVAHDLGTALGFEMDRLTPFTADEVFWTASPPLRNPARGELRLTLRLVLRQPVEQLSAALAGIGLLPSFIETGAGRITLGRRQTPRNRQDMLIYALCVALGVACLITPVIRQSLALSRANSQLASLVPARDEAMRLNRRLAVAASGQAAITAARESVDTLTALAAITTALPDDTFLTDLTLNSGDLTIDGESGNAARLIGVLAATGTINNPRFAAPVTRAIDGGEDLFSIHARIAP